MFLAVLKPLVRLWVQWRVVLQQHFWAACRPASCPAIRSSMCPAISRFPARCSWRTNLKKVTSHAFFVFYSSTDENSLKTTSCCVHDRLKYRRRSGLVLFLPQPSGTVSLFEDWTFIPSIILLACVPSIVNCRSGLLFSYCSLQLRLMINWLPRLSLKGYFMQRTGDSQKYGRLNHQLPVKILSSGFYADTHHGFPAVFATDFRKRPGCAWMENILTAARHFLAKQSCFHNAQ